MFNMLDHRLGTWDGVRVLDGCCGTGALGLEALSRGALHATFMDSGRNAIELAKRNAAALAVKDQCAFVMVNVGRPPKATLPCHLIMLDPPYGKGIADKGLAALTGAGWAAPAALAVIEVGRDDAFVAPEGWMIESERIHGAAKILLLTYA